MVKFGQDIVKYAVLRATEPSKDIIGILKSFDKKAFKSMRHIDVLKWYIENNNMASAIRFASIYIKNFTNNELVGFVLPTVEVSPTLMSIELRARELFVHEVRLLIRYKKISGSVGV